MEFEKIADYSDFEEQVRRFLAGPPKGTVIDNCYLFPAKIAAACAEGRLRRMPEHGQQLAFLQKEHGYERLYLYWRSGTQLQLAATQNPVLAEVMYSEGKLSEQTIQLCQALEHNGFFLHKNVQQFSFALTDPAALEQQASELERHCRQQGFLFGAARQEDLKEIFALWDICIDPYAFVYTSQAQWLQEAAAGRLLCIKDQAGHIVAAQQYSVEQKKSFESHIAVLPQYRGKKLAAVLLAQWLHLAAQAGCRNAFCWIAQDNAASLALHRAFIKRNKISMQYVRK